MDRKKIIIFLYIFIFVLGTTIGIIIFNLNKHTEESNNQNTTINNDEKKNESNENKEQNDKPITNDIPNMMQQNFDDKNNIYAKKYVNYNTEYDAGAMNIIKLLENIYVYKRNINNDLTNQELLQMAFDIYLNEIKNNKALVTNGLGLTDDIINGSKIISLSDLNDISKKYFGKSVTAEDIKWHFLSSLNSGTMLFYKDNLKGFVYNNKEGSGIRDLNVYSRYVTSSYDSANQILTIEVANVYSAPQFYDTTYYYSVDTIDNKDYALINIDFDPQEDDETKLQPYDKLYQLSLNKLQHVIYKFNVSNSTYKFLSLNF